MGLLNIHDIMFAHNVYVRKLSLQLATPRAESALYNCLVENVVRLI